MKKFKLDLDGQISHMKNEKGILFSIVNEESAKEFLRYNNYYFKIKAYAKNYDQIPKGENKGKYKSLEFAYLQELSTLDMYFRAFILELSLNIEHALKTKLLRDVTDNEVEDGYEIISDLVRTTPYLAKKITDRGKDSATANIVAKYDSDFAIWNIVEVLDFGDFIKLYRLYYEKYSYRYPTKGSVESCLWSVKFLRNAAAHNNCLLNNLSFSHPFRFQKNKQVSHYISRIPGIKKDFKNRRMKNLIIHDFVVMLYVFNEIVRSYKIKQKVLSDIKHFVDVRLVRNKQYFENNDLMKSNYRFIKIIIDHFYSTSI